MCLFHFKCYWGLSHTCETNDKNFIKRLWIFNFFLFDTTCYCVVCVSLYRIYLVFVLTVSMYTCFNNNDRQNHRGLVTVNVIYLLSLNWVHVVCDCMSTKTLCWSDIWSGPWLMAQVLSLKLTLLHISISITLIMKLLVITIDLSRKYLCQAASV